MARKQLYLLSLLSLYIALVGGISVAGLLQSTERVGTSGIITQPPPPSPSPPSPPPPEPAVKIDIYGDFECTHSLSTIGWGAIRAGGSVQKKVYIKNSGDQPVSLSLSTENWTPAKVAGYMVLSWDYEGIELESGAIVEVTLKLTVDSSIKGIETFGFEIVVIGSAS